MGTIRSVRGRSTSGGKGAGFEQGKLTLEQLAEIGSAGGEVKLTSGQQELYETSSIGGFDELSDRGEDSRPTLLRATRVAPAALAPQDARARSAMFARCRRSTSPSMGRPKTGVYREASERLGRERLGARRFECAGLEHFSGGRQ
ncbi:hypothetical protein WME91_39165 [Sorangium sp. So ce269]